MNDKTPVVLSPEQRNTQINTQVDETVKMSTYKIKKQLEMQRVKDKVSYDNLKKHLSEDLHPLRTEIENRCIAAAKEIALTKAVGVLNVIYDYIDVGDDETYFDDNRGDSVDHAVIAEVMVSEMCCYIRELTDFHAAEVSYHLNVWGSISDDAYNLDRIENVIFTPKTLRANIPLQDEEIGTLNNIRQLEGELREFNLSINEIDKKLKELPKIAEDIEYALLKAKAEAEGATTAIDLSDKITAAYLQDGTAGGLLLK